MKPGISILIKTIKAGRADDLLRENRTEIVAHLTKHYDEKLAERLDKIKNTRPVTS